MHSVEVSAREKGAGDVSKGEKVTRTYEMYYQNKTKDVHLYNLMKEAYKLLQQGHILEQSQHPYDTQNMRAWTTLCLGIDISPRMHDYFQKKACTWEKDK
eukprot:13072226-Ditylum_brightwellii.AAC.1